MPKRKRWTPVKGTRNRIYEPWERAAVACVDLALRAVLSLTSKRNRKAEKARDEREAIRRVLVLRLDRMGDVIMSLPALAEMRAALPKAHIALAVGAWSHEIARSAPVDELIVWSAPWVGRKAEGTQDLRALFHAAHSMRRQSIDLAIDLQGDLRSSLLMFLSGARIRVGYANAGGAALLTRIVPLDETVSWVEQNRNAIHRALGDTPREGFPAMLTETERESMRERLASLGLLDRRPLVGIHPSGGRPIKQWDMARWREVARQLQSGQQATILITGSSQDTPLAQEIARGLPASAFDLTGRLSVREMLALMAALDLFLSSDTGPMHMACAIGTPSVSLFGPSDPDRYFFRSKSDSTERHVVLHPNLWCSPCNMIRKPPLECLMSQPPECLRMIEAAQVLNAAASLLTPRTKHTLTKQATEP